MNTNERDERELRDAVIGTCQRGGPDCVTDVMIEAVIELVKSAQRDTATRMRDKCVVHLRKKGEHIESTANHLPSGDRTRELHVEARAFYQAARELESVKLEVAANSVNDDGEGVDRGPTK